MEDASMSTMKMRKLDGMEVSYTYMSEGEEAVSNEAMKLTPMTFSRISWEPEGRVERTLLVATLREKI
jgi:hypothetical protein